jgi:NAD(P)H-flavin reductase
MSTAAADSAGSLEPEATAPYLPRMYRLGRHQRELADTVTLEVRPVSGDCPIATPGQFNMLYAFGAGEIPISVSGDCGDGQGFVHTVREVGPVSRALAALAPGEFLGVRGPFGAGWPLAGAEGADLLVIAGGLGLAPLRPVIRHVIRTRARFGRVAVLCGARNPQALLYRDELALWRQSLAVELTVDHAGVGWGEHVGVVPDLIGRTRFDPADTIAMVCGPEVMMRLTAESLVAAGVARERIHLSLERNMKCAIGHCGHCQLGPAFVCRDGPVMRYDRIAGLLTVREL